ncbi:MAG: ABC transporter substrate-binding protein [Agathobacter sp.]|nr:ABC transporter substrate-binding protein [Agathobacter sp.]
MKNVINKKVILLLVICLALGNLAGCQQADTAEYDENGKEIIIMGYLPITHALAVFEAKELIDKSPDSNITVKLQKFSNWTDLMDALNSGKIQAASVLAELAMGAVSQGINLKAVALGHKDGNIVVVSNNINSVEDLRGKTFAIPSNQSSHNILLQDMLATAGMGFRDLNVIMLSPPEMPASLASGAIDGYCVAEPFGTQAVLQGFGKTLYTSETLWENSICCALVFNGKYLESHKASVDEFLKYYREGGQNLDSREAKRIAVQYLGQKEPVLDESLKCISYDDLELKEEDYKVLYQKVKDYQINANPPSFEEFVYISGDSKEEK